MAHGTDSTVFKRYRNLVNRERKLVEGGVTSPGYNILKDEHPKRWWDEVKGLSGAKTKNDDLYTQI